MDEELEMDESAYEMYHQAQTNAPCLSFDVIIDDLGSNRTEYPHTCFLVSGTQAESTQTNNVIVMKMSNLKKTLKEKNSEDEDSDDEDSESEDEEEGPELETAMIRHSGCVNRIRATKLNDRHVAASWSELGKVSIWDLTSALRAVTDTREMSEFVKKDSTSPLYQFAGHQTEGFALDWSPQVSGQLATGDCHKNIHVWRVESGQTSWVVDQRPYAGHTASVEDIQWSPNEPTVFASCSADRTIRVWDIRASPLKANMITAVDAHLGDVNVINWNRNEPFIVSGGDDAQLKVWDLRLFKENKAVAVLKFHTKPITSVEWNVNDSSVFAASGEDNQLTIWDLSVEKDDEQMDENDTSGDLPPQLLFIHEGQKEMKELHWHAQIPGVIISTAHTGFNVFKTIST